MRYLVIGGSGFIGSAMVRRLLKEENRVRVLGGEGWKIAYCPERIVQGHAAMMVTEGLPNFIANKLREKYDLSKTKAGILGMAFKAGIDDTRDSYL